MREKMWGLLIIQLIAMFIYGETFYVPEDYTTIQGAIDAVENGDVIILSPGTYYENIDYNGKQILVSSLFYETSDPQYISETVIDGGGNDCVVRILGVGGYNSGLSGLTLSNGNYSHGGGIYLWGSPVNLSNLIITGNVAVDGGGIHCDWSMGVFIDNVMITNNESTDDGGGIYINYSTVTINNSMIYNNSGNNGGGIYIEDGILNMNNDSVCYNQAERGGGIHIHCSDSNMNEVKILGNHATIGGGGIYTWYSDPYLSNVIITQNSSDGRGGGLRCQCALTPVFSSTELCDIYLNNTSCSCCGNDIYSDSFTSVILDTFTVMNPTEYHIQPRDSTQIIIQSGKIEQYNQDLYVSTTGNNSNSGLNPADPLKTIQYALCSILPEDGDTLNIFLDEGLYSPTSNGEHFPIMLPSYVHLCGTGIEEVVLDAEESNRVIWEWYAGNIKLSNLTITGGNQYFGAGLYCENTSINLENVLFCENMASYWGGGINGEFSELFIKDVRIENNYAGDTGGGICLSHCVEVEMSNVSITNNESEYGGGISMFSSEPVLRGVKIANNLATAYGGGINSYNSEAIMQRVDICGNISEYTGGGMYLVDDNSIMVNVTIADNEAFANGGAMTLNQGSHINIVNGILWGNTPDEVCYWTQSDFNEINFAYCDVQGGMENIFTYDHGQVNWLGENIDADPMFLNPLTGDYNLDLGSPCIDTGIAYFEYNGQILADLSEEDYEGTAPDLGAYEYGMSAIETDFIMKPGSVMYAYPNPFNPQTVISFELVAPADEAVIEIFNIKGQKILDQKFANPISGKHQMVWQGIDKDGKATASGVYFYRLKVDNKTCGIQRMLLLK
ncbi:MAG: DUF1565 domain-containing protein [Candidatus Stygibacter australis]|nr:DUF1565 domain-containing protein [Candidatus Stygibacter australis]MDP8321610.1 DUF1565 domain-containing protein [Candidatus Stygibacter australis]